jgi:hypothetical protein
MSATIKRTTPPTNSLRTSTRNVKPITSNFLWSHPANPTRFQYPRRDISGLFRRGQNRVDLENVKISSWTHSGKALLFASHLERKSVTAHVQLDRKKLDLKKRLQVKDALTGENLPLNGDEVPVSFNGMSFRLLEIFTK